MTTKKKKKKTWVTMQCGRLLPPYIFDPIISIKMWRVIINECDKITVVSNAVNFYPKWKKKMVRRFKVVLVYMYYVVFYSTLLYQISTNLKKSTP